MKRTRHRVTRVFLSIFLSLAAVTLISCASSNLSNDEASGSITPATDLGELTSTEKLFYTQSYAGYLVVFLDESLGARLDSGKSLYSTSGKDAVVGAIQEILSKYSGAALKPSVDVDPAKLDARRAELEMLSRTKLADFNSIYHVTMSNPDDAVRMIRELNTVEGVTRAYPKLIGQGVTLAQTPDLTVHQGYLYPEATHGGLNAMAAWNVGVRGEGVTLVDGDVGWNFSHEDISYPVNFMINATICPVGSTDPDCPYSWAHGTAMTGIMAAADNGHGITGMAPNVEINGATISAGVGEYLVLLTDGEPNASAELEPGSIFTIIVGYIGPNTPGQSCNDTPYGCLPVEVDEENFAGIQYALAAGVTIVEGAANGEQNLDDPNSYWPWSVNLSQNDSGSILVGASNGGAKQKAWFTNYGTPIDTFAWGEGVAATGYPIPEWDWVGAVNPLPPDPMDTNAFFTDEVAGTSPAAAMIGGAAALIQSYAKQQMGSTRYLMPNKMREILVNSGVSQVGGGGNIGKQPRIDIAMGLVDQAWNAWGGQYPELETGNHLTQSEMISLRLSGLGIVCKDSDPAGSDPTCPDDSVWIPGSGVAKALDFDADGRADLISWKNGQFKIDLSSLGTEADQFGSWDVIVNYPQIAGSIVWPYVEDMNSDGREDLVVYDKENGVWYISYTTSAMLSGGGFQGWDHIITTNVHDEYEMDPWQSQYCRPEPGDFDGNGWVDLAVACSDGIWYIAHSTGVDWASNVTYDREVTYLSQAELQAAPGWAYLVSTARFTATLSDTRSDIIIKYPDGIADAGKMIVKAAPNFTGNFMNGVPNIFGGNSEVILSGKFTIAGYYSSVGLKNAEGQWAVADPDYWSPLNDPSPNDVFGGLSCHPVVADFDGDDLDDRAVMCPDGWRIAYSGNGFLDLLVGGVRYVDLIYNVREFTIPGRPYSGNIKYSMVLELIKVFKDLNPNQSPPIPVDMVTISTCQLSSGGECQ